MKGIILFAHGARDARWAEPFLRLQQIVAEQQPQTQVMLAYLELMSPDLPSAVAGLVANQISDISIAPLFLGPGSHLRNDFPVLLAQLKQQYPTVAFHVLPSLGESESMLNAIAAWILQGISHAPD